jgi:hypothetical protein
VESRWNCVVLHAVIARLPNTWKLLLRDGEEVTLMAESKYRNRVKLLGSAGVPGFVLVSPPE